MHTRDQWYAHTMLMVVQVTFILRTYGTTSEQRSYAYPRGVGISKIERVIR